MFSAGGSGIHRPLQKKATDFGKEYRAKVSQFLKVEIETSITKH